LLPRIDGFVAEGTIRMLGRTIVPVNWLQIMENSMDPIHTEWLHGHTYAVHLRMRGEQDEWGIVLDFGAITDTLKAIGDEIDHLVLVPTESNHYSDLKVTKKDVKFRVTDPFTGEPKDFSFPRQDCALLSIPSTTAEDLAKYVYREFVKRTEFKTATAFVEVGIDEGYGKGAWYSDQKGVRVKA
ncbi:MAG: 6-carboxytetrahydropterin synthase, partial [Thermoplasmatota archaeon]